MTACRMHLFFRKFEWYMKRNDGQYKCAAVTRTFELNPMGVVREH